MVHDQGQAFLCVFSFKPLFAMDSTQTQDQYLNASEAAALLEISRPTFDRAVRFGQLPRGFTLTGRPNSHKRWSKTRLLEVLASKAA